MVLYLVPDFSQHIRICSIAVKPYIVAYILSLSACGRVLNAEIHVIKSQIVPAFYSSPVIGVEVNIYVQFPVICQRQTDRDVATCRSNIRHSIAPAFLAFLIDNRLWIYAQILYKPFGKRVGIFYGFLLGIAHISVCLVEVAFNRFGFIITEQCKLLIYLFELVINEGNPIIYLLFSCRSFDVAFCLVCSNLCLACNSFCICCCLFIFFSPFVIAMIYDFLFYSVCMFLYNLFCHDCFSSGKRICVFFVEIGDIECANLVIGSHISGQTTVFYFGQISRSIVECFEIWTDYISEVGNHCLCEFRKFPCSFLDMINSHFSTDSKNFRVNADIELTQFRFHPPFQFLIAFISDQLISARILFV